MERNSRAIVKRLLAEGFELVKVSGSHHKFRKSLIHKSRSTPSFCQYRTNGYLFSMHFGIKLPESGENRPDFGMSPTYGSDSKGPITVIVPHPKKDLPVGTVRAIAKLAGWM